MTPSVCAGYSVTNYRVLEAADAWNWREKGSLTVKYEHPHPALLSLIDSFGSGVAGANDFYSEELRKKND